MNLKAVGKEIVKANFGNAFNQLLGTGSYRGNTPRNLKEGLPIDIVNFGGDGVGAFFSWTGISSSLTAYDECPPLQSVCNRRALAFINGEISILNSAGKPSTSPQSKKVLKLLNNPNPLQTRSQFLAQIHIYLDLVGYCVVVPLRPVGYEMSEAEQLYVVPPIMAELGSNSYGLNFISGGIDYVMVGGVRVNPADVMIIADINPSVSDMVKPGAKIKSLELPINNIIGAYESESTLIKQRGPSGIISPEPDKQLGGAVPLIEEDKLAIQSSFNRRYGLLAGQSHIILATASALKYQKTGFNAEELGLHKAIENSTKAICDTIGFPTELMGIVNPTYSNKESADKEVFTKYIIPSSVNIAEQLGSYLLPITDKLIFDYSHVPEMQADKVKEATAKKAIMEAMKIAFDLDLVTLNQMLKQIDIEPLMEGGDLRKSQIPPGNVPLAVTLGVGGIQALTEILSAQGISDDARQASLEIIFGLKPEDALRMSSAARVTQSQNTQNATTATTSGN